MQKILSEIRFDENRMSESGDIIQDENFLFRQKSSTSFSSLRKSLDFGENKNRTINEVQFKLQLIKDQKKLKEDIIQKESKIKHLENEIESMKIEQFNQENLIQQNRILQQKIDDMHTNQGQLLIKLQQKDIQNKKMMHKLNDFQQLKHNYIDLQKQFSLMEDIFVDYDYQKLTYNINDIDDDDQPKYKNKFEIDAQLLSKRKLYLTEFAQIFVNKNKILNQQFKNNQIEVSKYQDIISKLAFQIKEFEEQETDYMNKFNQMQYEHNQQIKEFQSKYNELLHENQLLNDDKNQQIQELNFKYNELQHEFQILNDERTPKNTIYSNFITIEKLQSYITEIQQKIINDQNVYENFDMQIKQMLTQSQLQLKNSSKIQSKFQQKTQSKQDDLVQKLSEINILLKLMQPF